MDDGTKTAIAFCLVGPDPSGEHSFSTLVNVIVTLADGREFLSAAPGSITVSAVGTDQCALHFGPHSAVGDLNKYRVIVEPIEGVGVELSYEALVEPYRPGGTAQIALTGDGEFHYGIQPVARCRVSGTVTVDGKTIDVTGQGYHDHQWSDVDLLESWHHWLWGRLYTEHYTVLVDDLTTSERFGFTRIPLFGLFDASGALVFDNRGDAETRVETYRDVESGKDYPKRSTYVFRDGQRVIELDFEWTDVLSSRSTYIASADDVAPELGGGQRERFDAMGIRPSYARYRADGSLTITDHDQTVTEHGEMIYELNYVGRPDSRAPLHSAT